MGEAPSTYNNSDYLNVTVPFRRNLTGNANTNGNGTDTEWVQSRTRMNTERIQNGNGNACKNRKKISFIKCSLLGFF